MISKEKAEEARGFLVEAMVLVDKAHAVFAECGGPDLAIEDTEMVSRHIGDVIEGVNWYINTGRMGG